MSHYVTSQPFLDGSGSVVFAARFRGPFRLRYVALVVGTHPHWPRRVSRRALLAFAEALDDDALPVPLPGGEATVEPAPGARLPVVAVTWRSGSGTLYVGPLASAARGTAGPRLLRRGGR